MALKKAAQKAQKSKRTPAKKASKSKAIKKSPKTKKPKAKAAKKTKAKKASPHHPHLMTLNDKIAFLDEHNKKYEKTGFSTKAVHYGQPCDPFYGSVNMPIHLTSTYAQVDAAQPYFKFDYSRCGNPTREALCECMASLEGGKHAIAFSSGCSVTMIICHMLASGDHILSVDDVYGGTGRFF